MDNQLIVQELEKLVTNLWEAFKRVESDKEKIECDNAKLRREVRALRRQVELLNRQRNRYLLSTVGQLTQSSKNLAINEPNHLNPN